MNIIISYRKLLHWNASKITEVENYIQSLLESGNIEKINGAILNEIIRKKNKTESFVTRIDLKVRSNDEFYLYFNSLNYHYYTEFNEVNGNLYPTIIKEDSINHSDIYVEVIVFSKVKILPFTKRN